MTKEIAKAFGQKLLAEVTKLHPETAGSEAIDDHLFEAIPLIKTTSWMQENEDQIPQLASSLLVEVSDRRRVLATDYLFAKEYQDIDAGEYEVLSQGNVSLSIDYLCGQNGSIDLARFWLMTVTK